MKFLMLLLCVSSLSMADDTLIHFGKPSRDAKLSFVTWNIYKGKMAGWDRDLASLDADYKLLQETWLTPQNQMETSLDLINGFGWTMATSWLYKNYPTGVVTGSTEAPLSEQYIRSKQLEPFIKQPKITLIQTYRDFTLVNFYGMSALSSDVNWEANLEEVITVLESYKGNMVIAGDFNSGGGNRNTVLESDLSTKLGMEHVGFSPDPRSKLGDNVFVRGFTVVSSMVHPEIVSSDHSPLTVTLGFK